MNQETIVAVVGAITKWDLMAQSIQCEDDVKCPLCVVFHGSQNTCLGCPVMNISGYTQCSCTPYARTRLDSNRTLAVELSRAKDVTGYPMPNLDAVEEEIEFLISLLPVGSKEAKAYEL